MRAVRAIERGAYWAAAVLFAVSAAGVAVSRPASASEVPDYGNVQPPPQFVAFCDDYPAECRSVGISNAHIVLDAKTYRFLEGLNAEVNRSIRYANDWQVHGIDDHWSLGEQGVGDCEDYALQKRHRLLRLGWPSSVLLLASALSPSGEGHGVLLVRTHQGDIVLDNTTDRVLAWDDTGLRFKFRQSGFNPMQWRLIDPDAAE